MTLNVGVQVKVLEKFGDGWWKVMTTIIENEQSKELIGLYPSNYLHEEISKNNNSNNNNSIISTINANTNLLNGCFGLSHNNSIKNEVS